MLLQLLARDLRGEMTLPVEDECQPSLQSSTLGLGIAQLLGLSQADAVRDALTPSLACAAARAGDLEALRVLTEMVSPHSPPPARHARPRENPTTALCPGPPGWAASLCSLIAAKGGIVAVPGPTLGVHPDPSHPLRMAYLTLPSPSSVGDMSLCHLRAVT